MSDIKQLPRRKRVHVLLGSLFAVIAIAAFTVGFLKDHGREGSMTYLYFLVVFLVAGVILAITGRPLRCPDCGKFLREQAHHPKADETYLYYCKRCDVTWDTTVRKSD